VSSVLWNSLLEVLFYLCQDFVSSLEFIYSALSWWRKIALKTPVIDLFGIHNNRNIDADLLITQLFPTIYIHDIVKDAESCKLCLNISYLNAAAWQ